jgi:hypothetical protein
MWSMLWKWFLVEGNTRQSLTCRPGMFLNPEQAPPVAENQPQIAKPKREVSPPKRDESRSNSTRTLTADDGNWPIFSGMSNSFKDLDDADESDDSDEQSPFKTIMPDD